MVPGASASAITVPLPLPTATPSPLSLPVAPAGALTMVSGSTWTGGGGSTSEAAPAVSGDEVLSGLRDPNLLGLAADALNGDRSSQNQGPGDNRGLSQQSDQATSQQYLMTAQIYALDLSQDALDAAFAGGGSGRFAWPEQTRTISQGFGCTNVRQAPANSQCPSGHFHTGLDIAGINLVDVHAADTGVARVFHGTTGYGNYVIVTHGNGFSSLYGHLNDIVVKDGQLVQRGDLIAHEGTTGNSTGPHLHFEIRQYGNYLDPCPYLEACKGY